MLCNTSWMTSTRSHTSLLLLWSSWLPSSPWSTIVLCSSWRAIAVLWLFEQFWSCLGACSYCSLSSNSWICATHLSIKHFTVSVTRHFLLSRNVKSSSLMTMRAKKLLPPSGIAPHAILVARFDSSRNVGQGKLPAGSLTPFWQHRFGGKLAAFWITSRGYGKPNLEAPYSWFKGRNNFA